jgi:hypothetical protein
LQGVWDLPSELLRVQELVVSGVEGSVLRSAIFAEGSGTRNAVGANCAYVKTLNRKNAISLAIFLETEQRDDCRNWAVAICHSNSR